MLCVGVITLISTGVSHGLFPKVVLQNCKNNHISSVTGMLMVGLGHFLLTFKVIREYSKQDGT